MRPRVTASPASRKASTYLATGPTRRSQAAKLRERSRATPSWSTTGASTSKATRTPTRSRGSSATLKPAIRGTYKKVSHKWLQGHLNEFYWRYNHRHDIEPMFDLLISRAARGA